MGRSRGFAPPRNHCVHPDRPKRQAGFQADGMIVAKLTLMKVAFALLALLHGLIHLFGFAKGLGLAHIPQLQLPISRGAGLLWLGASVLLVFGSSLVFLGPRYWGIAVLCGLLLSQFLVLRHFKDAKFGTVANVLLLVPALVNALDLRPTSLRSEYEAATARIRTAAHAAPKVITEADLAHLPEPVQRYLRRVGAVGKPRVVNLQARMSVQIRRSPNDQWLEGAVEQYDSFEPDLRFFFLEAKRGPLAFDVAHLFDERGATMRARVFGLFTVMEAAGPELTRSETVTLLNDMCLLAPSTLVGANLEWTPIDATTAGVKLRQGSEQVSAMLTFSAEGDLLNFMSHDRTQSDGKTSARYPWWTPISDYRNFGPYRLGTIGEAQWEEPSGLWTYARIKVLDVQYNVGIE